MNSDSAGAVTNEELIQTLLHEADGLSAHGDSGSALEARRLANDLREAIRLYRVAADEAHRLGSQTRSPHATPQEIAAFGLARTLARERRKSVSGVREQALRFLQAPDASRTPEG